MVQLKYNTFIIINQPKKTTNISINKATDKQFVNKADIICKFGGFFFQPSGFNKNSAQGNVVLAGVLFVSIGVLCPSQ